MFGQKAQKIDKKALIATIDTDLDSISDGLESLVGESGKSRQEILDACLADDEVESCREDVRTALLAANWRIWGEDVDEAIINRLYRMLHKQIEIFADIAVLASFNGYAVAEYLWRQEPDGFWILHQVLSKDGELERYQPKRDGSVVLNADEGEIVIDQEVKYLVLTSKAIPARPAGEMRILRAYPAVILRKRGLAYAGQFVRRYAQPYVIGKQSGFGALNEFVSKLFGFANGGAVAVGKDDDISLHQLAGNGEAFVLIERLTNARIQKLILGRVKTGDLENGSRAAQETEENTRQDRVSAYLKLLAKAVQHALDALIIVNARYGRPIAPKGLWFEYESAESINLVRAQRDKLYCDTGQMRLSKDYLVNIVGYEESHIEMIDVPAAIPLSLAAPSNSATQAEQDALEQRIMAAKLALIDKALAESEDYGEFERKLAQLSLPDAGLYQSLATQAAQAKAAGQRGKTYEH